MLFFPSEGTAIKCANPTTNFLPCNLINLAFALLLEILEERLVMADRINGISQSVDIPLVNLDTVVENLSTARLLRDN